MAKSFMTNIVIGGKLNPSLQKAFNNASKYAEKSANLINKAGTKINSTLDSVSKKASAVANVAKKVAVAGAIVGSAALLGGSTMLEQASNLEQYRNTLNVVMKDNKKAAETFKWAVEFANKTPYETDELVDATVKLQAYGLEAQKILPFVGDMASAMGKGLDQAVEAVSDAQTGELARLKEFGITKQMIVEQASKKLQGIEVVNNKGQITNQKAFNLALFSLMQERYKGSMDIQSKSWKGLISTITGVAKSGIAQIAGISQTGEIIPGSAFDTVKQKASQLADVFTKLQESGKFDELQKKLSNLVSGGMKKIEESAPKVIEFTQKLIDNGPQIISTAKFIGEAFIGWKVISGLGSGVQALMSLHKTLNTLKTDYLLVAGAKAKDALATLYLQGLYAKDAIVAAMKTAGTWSMIAAQGTLNAVTAVGTGIMTGFGAVLAFITSPIGLVVIAVGALIAAGVLLYNNWDKVSNFLSNSWEGIKDSFNTGVNWLADKFNWFIEKLNKIPGIEIPLITKEQSAGQPKKYALGGLANKASIFGEAGLEMAIPIKPKNPRSISLLSQTARMLGVSSSGNGGNPTFIFAPNLYGNTSPEVKSALEFGFEQFKQMLEQYMHENGRLEF